MSVAGLLLYGTAHHVKQLLCYGKPQPGAFHRVVHLHIHSLELGKELREVLIPYPYPGIGHARCQLHLLADLVPALLLPGDRQGHAAPLRIFHRVVQQIGQHLPQAYLIPEERIGKIIVYLHDKLQSLGLSPEYDHIAHIVQHGAQLISSFSYLQLSRLDLGEIKDVIDDGEQIVACTVDVSRIFRDV